MSSKKELIIALGTNVNQEHNMKQAIGLLTNTWSNIRFTSQRWTRPIGISSDSFLNCLGFIEINEKVDEVNKILKTIEQKCGNTFTERSLNRIQMDIDILKYGNQRLHIDDWQRKYIQHLMHEIDFYRTDL